MKTIPPPMQYRSENLNKLIRTTTPENIDRVIPAYKDILRTDKSAEMRLSAAIHLEALRIRRDQYVRCGVLQANAEVTHPESKL